MPTFHDRLRDLKEQKKVLAKEIAEACGVTPQSVHGWLKDILPRTKHLSSLAAYFGTTTDYLVHGNPSPERVAIIRELLRLGAKLSDSQLKALLITAREFVKQT